VRIQIGELSSCTPSWMSTSCKLLAIVYHQKLRLHFKEPSARSKGMHPNNIINPSTRLKQG
jgi:hypothetical protein